MYHIIYEQLRSNLIKSLIKCSRIVEYTIATDLFSFDGNRIDEYKISMIEYTSAGGEKEILVSEYKTRVAED